MEKWRVFIVVLPGLEELALEELRDKLPLEELAVTKGGIEATASLEWIEHAHLLLKIPTRILLRITSFRVRDFPKLHQKFASFGWTSYLSHPEPEWEISCSKSRLNHTGRIEETLRTALSEALRRQPLSLDWQKKKYSPQTFYVRLSDDELTLSLDLTGEPLYKRGLQPLKGEAPLRENIAAALLLKLTQGLPSGVALVDPMCGSGTFLTEAMHWHTPLHLRNFAFETAPFYRGRILQVKKAPLVSPLPVSHALGFDLNTELIAKIRSSANLGLEVRAQDSLAAKLEVSGEYLMVCNPPYGERLGIKGKRGQFLREAREKFLTVDRPLRLGFLVPSDFDDLFPEIEAYRVHSKLAFRNGGLAVTFWVWERR